jgi:hypothetical protein
MLLGLEKVRGTFVAQLRLARLVLRTLAASKSQLEDEVMVHFVQETLCY